MRWQRTAALLPRADEVIEWVRVGGTGESCPEATLARVSASQGLEIRLLEVNGAADIERAFSLVLTPMLSLCTKRNAVF